jgi:hypothetical protein
MRNIFRIRKSLANYALKYHSSSSNAEIYDCLCSTCEGFGHIRNSNSSKNNLPLGSPMITCPSCDGYGVPPIPYSELNSQEIKHVS